MGWDGDISQMGQLATNLRRLGQVPSRAAARVSSDIAALIEEEFEQGADPYGRAWAPLAKSTLAKGRTPPPLTDTGAMRSSVDVRPMRGAGLSITIDHPAAPHQTGWSGSQGSGPARPILPGAAFPARWRDAVRAAVDVEIREAIR
jgi:hypothetical protein